MKNFTMYNISIVVTDLKQMSVDPRNTLDENLQIKKALLEAFKAERLLRAKIQNMPASEIGPFIK